MRVTADNSTHLDEAEAQFKCGLSGQVSSSFTTVCQCHCPANFVHIEPLPVLNEPGRLSYRLFVNCLPSRHDEAEKSGDVTQSSASRIEWMKEDDDDLVVSV